MKHFISIHPSVIIWLSILYYLQPRVVFPFLAASLLHELGHLICLYRIRKPPVHLTVTFSGAKISTPVLSYREELTAASAGPITSFLVALLFPLFPVMSSYSIMLGLSNLLPMPALDGWRILKSTLSLHVMPEKADLITNITSIAAASLLTIVACSISRIWNLGMWPVIIATVYLLRALQNYQGFSLAK